MVWLEVRDDVTVLDGVVVTVEVWEVVRDDVAVVVADDVNDVVGVDVTVVLGVELGVVVAVVDWDVVREVVPVVDGDEVGVVLWEERERRTKKWCPVTTIHESVYLHIRTIQPRPYMDHTAPTCPYVEHTV